MAFLGIGNKKKSTKQAAKRAPAKRAAAEQPAVVAAPATGRTSTNALGALRILKRPYVSERASQLMTQNQYVFEVAADAAKPEIRKQIQQRYGVTVTAVRTVHLPGKVKNIGRHSGFRAGAKKAIVRLAPGDTIDQAKP